MKAMRIGWIIAAGIMPLPALAGAGESPASCWAPDRAAGIFDWQQAPSLACRDGITVDGTAIAAPDATPASLTVVPVQAQAETPSASFSFSGQAYFGIATTF